MLLCMPEDVGGELYLLEVMRRVLLCMLNVPDVFDVPEVMRRVLLFMPDVPEVMRCVLLCTPEAVEGVLCATLYAGCDALYAGGRVG